MISKISFTAIALLLAVPSLSFAADRDGAKGTSSSEVRRGWIKTGPAENNWFVSAGGGAQMYFGDHDRQLTFGQWVSLALDVAVGKWFNPSIGARIMYSGLTLNGATQDGTHSLGTDIKGKPQQGFWLENSRFGYFHLHADAMFNLCSIFGGYKEDRLYGCSPYVGVGLMRAYDAPVCTSFAFDAGIFNSFRVSPSIDINIDIRGTIVSDRFDGEVGGRSGEGLITVSAGLAYRFGPRGW